MQNLKYLFNTVAFSFSFSRARLWLVEEADPNVLIVSIMTF